MNYETKIVEIIEKIRQCDDFHNRCDYLLEHDEATYLIDYITQLDTKNIVLEEKNKELEFFIADIMTNEVDNMLEKEGEENVK